MPAGLSKDAKLRREAPGSFSEWATTVSGCRAPLPRSERFPEILIGGGMFWEGAAPSLTPQQPWQAAFPSGGRGPGSKTGAVALNPRLHLDEDSREGSWEEP